MKNRISGVDATLLKRSVGLSLFTVINMMSLNTLKLAFFLLPASYLLGFEHLDIGMKSVHLLTSLKHHEIDVQ